MRTSLDEAAADATLSTLRAELLAARVPEGHWVGELSSSALSTATAISALSLVDRQTYHSYIHRGLEWLAQNCNQDGGWGDTVRSVSNISTTALCWAAFSLARELATSWSQMELRARAWIQQYVGSLEPERLASAIADRYGTDHTFSVPILTNCALAGRLGEGREAWRWVEPLPFEMAALPQRFYKWLRLPVVSYALPALIAIGVVQHRHRPTRNPFRRLLRDLARQRTLNVLVRIQPPGGGFLEAVPLTSFVVMSLAASGLRDHSVVGQGIQFLKTSLREDGSWPIDTNLSTWVTTLSVNALAENSDFSELLPTSDRNRILDWLLGQQNRQEHLYTLAEPGGWAWTDLTGGVPDADDTSSVLLALRNLSSDDQRVVTAATSGVRWLIDLQNRDGGVPTFCRGWGTLPFDRSSPDITAHALMAWSEWLNDLPTDLQVKTKRSIERGIEYLAKVQRHDGSWIPLWFGNQFAENDENATYGTARVLRALRHLESRRFRGLYRMTTRGSHWLLSAQNADGGWGGAPSILSSIEETAVALEALAAETDFGFPAEDVSGRAPAALSSDRIKSAVSAAVDWLIKHTEGGKRLPPSPIGLYFAKLWYFERLYPLIFAVAGLEKASKRQKGAVPI
ncbi:MAG TPA: prenyltransferase/squalene oxidase repeat-containing protein [Acidobacteriota bacterium]